MLFVVTGVYVKVMYFAEVTDESLLSYPYCMILLCYLVGLVLVKVFPSCDISVCMHNTQ